MVFVVAFQHRNPKDGTQEFIELIKSLEVRQENSERPSKGELSWTVKQIELLKGGTSGMKFKKRPEWAEIDVWRLTASFALGGGDINSD